jgi:hypothetical protein
MPDTPVAIDVYQPPYVLVHLAPQLALDPVVLIDELTQAGRLGFRQVFHSLIGIHSRMLKDLVAPGAADPIDVGQADLDSFAPWQVNA